MVPPLKSFTPRPSQLVRDRALKKHNDSPPLLDQPYTLWVWFPWWRRTKPWPFHTTKQFIMNLKIQLDRDKIQEQFNKRFSGEAKVYSNLSLYIVELEQEHTLHEIQDIVNQVLKELAE